MTSAGSRLQADISQAIRRSGPLVFIPAKAKDARRQPFGRRRQ